VSSATEISVLQRLRQETQLTHARVETRVVLPDRVRSAADYRALRETFYGLYRPWESAVAAFAPQLATCLPDVLLQLRISALERDLEGLATTLPTRSLGLPSSLCKPSRRHPAASTCSKGPRREAR
jgi:heme oxygenase